MKILFNLFVFTLLLTTCASPSKTFKKGNYESAFKQTFKKVKKGKASKEEKNILIRSLNELNKSDIDATANLEHSEYISDWEKAWNRYEKLIKRNEEVKSCLPREVDFKFDFYQQKKEKIRDEIALEYTLYGNENMVQNEKTGLKKYAQEAYQDFNKALRYGGDEQMLAALKEEALSLGKIFYSVTLDTRFHDYSWDIKRAFQKLENESTVFKEINVDSHHSNPDCEIEIDFEDIDFRTTEQAEAREYSEQVVVRYETRVDTSGRAYDEPVYGDVYATVEKIVYTKTARLEVKIRSNSRSQDCNFNSRTYYDEIIQDEAEYTRVSGDERALPPGVRETNEELEDDDEMAEDLIEELFDTIRRVFRD